MGARGAAPLEPPPTPPFEVPVRRSDTEFEFKPLSITMTPRASCPKFPPWGHMNAILIVVVATDWTMILFESPGKLICESKLFPLMVMYAGFGAQVMTDGLIEEIKGRSGAGGVGTETTPTPVAPPET